MIICPQCQSKLVRGSQFQRHDVWAALQFLRPIRCRLCQLRFYARIWKSAKPRLTDKSHSSEINLKRCLRRFRPLSSIIDLALRKSA